MLLGYLLTNFTSELIKPVVNAIVNLHQHVFLVSCQFNLGAVLDN
jgi:hypothetical protein